MSKKLTAVINVTALTEPYAAAIAPEFSTENFLRNKKKYTMELIEPITLP